MKDSFMQKRYSNTTRKLYVPCPYPERTGIVIHVVIKEGYCYRSECMVIQCKYNRIQSDVEALMSLVW